MSTTSTSPDVDDAEATPNRSSWSHIAYYWKLLRIWCSGSNDSDESLSQDHLLARRMFYCGCLGLPWLWVVNVLYFRIRVYGSIPCWDAKKQEAANTEEEHVEIFTRVQVPGVTAAGHHPETATVATDAEDDSTHHEEEEEHDPIIEAELRKWVHRSTLGFLSVGSLFVAWILLFQLNKSSFGDNWFVMSPDDEEFTGW